MLGVPEPFGGTFDVAARSVGMGVVGLWGLLMGVVRMGVMRLVRLWGLLMGEVTWQ